MWEGEVAMKESDRVRYCPRFNECKEMKAAGAKSLSMAVIYVQKEQASQTEQKEERGDKMGKEGTWGRL